MCYNNGWTGEAVFLPRNRPPVADPYTRARNNITYSEFDIISHIVMCSRRDATGVQLFDGGKPPAAHCALHTEGAIRLIFQNTFSQYSNNSSKTHMLHCTVHIRSCRTIQLPRSLCTHTAKCVRIIAVQYGLNAAATTPTWQSLLFNTYCSNRIISIQGLAHATHVQLSMNYILLVSTAYPVYFEYIAMSLLPDRFSTLHKFVCRLVFYR